MKFLTMIRNALPCLMLAVVLTVAKPAAADIVTVLFTGFNPDSPSGMDFLNADLADRFANDYPSLTFSGQVFAYDQRQDALNFINGFTDIDQLFLVGHSWGGNALIRLAEQLLLPNGISVDASFQIDSVDIFDFGLEDDVLPANVETGYNYYQIATEPFEPQGETFVLGATNINVEVLFNDTTITHTSIDNDLRLYDVIYNNMQTSLVPEPGTMVIMGFGLVLVGLRRRSGVRILAQDSSTNSNH